MQPTELPPEVEESKSTKPKTKEPSHMAAGTPAVEPLPPAPALTYQQARDLAGLVMANVSPDTSPEEVEKLLAEEISHCTGCRPLVAPISSTPISTFFYRHCRDGDDEPPTPDPTMTATAVVSRQYPASSPEYKAQLVEAWEKVLATHRDDHELVAALDDI